MNEVIGEILPGRSVLQVFHAASDDLCAVAPLIATYGTAPKSSTAFFEIFRLGSGAGRIVAWLARRPRYLASVAALAWPFARLARFLFGLAARPSARRDFMDWPIVRKLLVPLASAQVRIDCIYDNEYVEFYFPTEHRSKGRHYLLRITSRDSSPGEAFAVHVSSGPERIEGHVWRPSTRPAAANPGLVARVAYAPEVSSEKVPPSLEISPVSQCNLNCIHCISRPTRETRTRLDPRIRDDIRKWARSGDLKTAYTDFSGDIFWADKRFGGELEFLTGLDVPFHIDTNGVEIDADSADLVFRSKVTSINVSIDAACTTTYQRVRRGAPPLEKIIGKMKLLVERRAANRRPDVQLSAAFVLMRSTIDEFPEFVRLVHRAGFDAARASHLQVYTADLHDESLWWDKPRFNAVQASAVKIARELGVRLYIDRAFEDRREQATGVRRLSVPSKVEQPQELSAVSERRAYACDRRAVGRSVDGAARRAESAIAVSPGRGTARAERRTPARGPRGRSFGPQSLRQRAAGGRPGHARARPLERGAADRVFPRCAIISPGFN